MDYKYVLINGEKTYFRIYKDGRLMSEKTGNFYKGTIRNGYRWFDIRYKNNKYSRSQHRLVAEAFIENPNNLEYVNHKDGNRLNNSIENLEWVNASTNNLKINRHSSGVDHSNNITYNDEELWRTFRDTIYMISTWGRVKNVKTNKILQGKITASGYREYCLTINKKKNSFRAHRLVYEVWVDSNMDIINHKDGNKLNNHISNLESVTSSENNKKAIYETKAHHFPRTAQYDLEGNLIRIYENNADAARHMNVKPQSIQAAISKGYKSCGFIWKNISEEGSSTNL